MNETSEKQQLVESVAAELDLGNRAIADLEEISAAMPDDAPHKHIETGCHIVDDIRDMIELQKERGKMLNKYAKECADKRHFIETTLSILELAVSFIADAAQLERVQTRLDTLASNYPGIVSTKRLNDFTKGGME